jgi:NADH-quinone oxidoreductase subunit N
MNWADLSPALPEIFLACASMAWLMVGVFVRGDALRLVTGLTVLGFVVTGFLVISGGDAGRTILFNGGFIIDDFATLMKLLVLLGTALAAILAVQYLEQEQLRRFEYPVLLSFAALGMMLMISANDFLSFYVGLELQSLAAYVLAAIRRDTVKSSEAGLKYFVLGALASGLLLYGISMVYGFTGSINFDTLAKVFADPASEPGIGLIFGLVFIAAALAFKMSAVPFHMWTPDVYEGAPTPVTAYFAIAPKVAAIALAVRVFVGPFGELFAQWQQIIIFIAVLSMLLGAFAAIAQNNIKRLMAYSSIGNMGYALVGLAAGSREGIVGVIVYMTIYLVTSAGAFAVILAMRRQGRPVEMVSDLAGLAKTHPLLALAMAFFMFSMAGIPPLAGFFAKLYVFVAAIDAGLIGVAIIGVLASVVSAYYYLRIVKVMYFDEATEPLDLFTGMGARGVLIGTALFAFPAFLLFQTPLLNAAAAAARSLMPV